MLNIAHRGFHQAFPDNTLEAFEAAIALGVDGVELDVHETADREFIVFHDPRLKGSDIKKLSLTQIKEVKLRDTFDIPTLEQALEVCRKRTRLLVELKKVWSLDKFLALLPAKIEPGDIIIISFDKDIVSKLWFLAPELQSGIITALPLANPVKLAQAIRCGTIVVRFPFIDAGLVKKARTSNLSVYVWGCPDIKAARKVLALDIDGIITDFPDQIKAVMG